MFVLLLCTWRFSYGKDHNLFGFVLLVFPILVFIHRAWMFNNVYIWTMMLLISSMKGVEYNRQKLNESRKAIGVGSNLVPNYRTNKLKKSRLGEGLMKIRMYGESPRV